MAIRFIYFDLGNVLVNFDHRLVDGELAGKFVEQIVYYLENFQSE